MDYRLSVNVPVESKKEREAVEQIINAAAEAGAGNVGPYERVAAIFDCQETWRPGPNAQPYNGEVGKVSVAKSVRIEMRCPEARSSVVVEAIRELHPYEEPVIELVKLEANP